MASDLARSIGTERGTLQTSCKTMNAAFDDIRGALADNCRQRVGRP